jgi:hypothetical protein
VTHFLASERIVERPLRDVAETAVEVLQRVQLMAVERGRESVSGDLRDGCPPTFSSTSPGLLLPRTISFCPRSAQWTNLVERRAAQDNRLEFDGASIAWSTVDRLAGLGPNVVFNVGKLLLVKRTAGV